MSIRALVIWLAVLAVLGMGLFLVTRPGPAKLAGVSASLLDVPADRVVRVKAGAGGAAREFVRGADGSWLVNSVGTGGWFADSDRLEALLKVLVQARGNAMDATIGKSGRVVELAASDGSSRRISFDDRELGGTVMAKVEGGGVARVLRAAANLPGLFSDESVATWVGRSVFPRGVADAAEIRIELAEYRVVLKRTGQRWAIVEPAGLPADQEEVGKLIKSLGQLAYSEFLPEAAEFRASGLKIEVASESRSIKGDQVERSVRTQSLAGGAVEAPGSARATAESTVSEADKGGQRAIRGMLDAASLEGVSANPAAYASRVISTLARADVRRIAVKSGTTAGASERVTELGVDGWKMKGDGAAIRAAELLDWLENEKAQHVVLSSGFGGAGNGTDTQVGLITFGPDEKAGQAVSIAVTGGEAFAGLNLPPGAKVVVARTGGRMLVYASPTALRQVASVFGENAVK